jgi:hypothetical protein
MSVDILILNTAVVDFRGGEFDFVEKLAGKGGLARGKTKNMPIYTQPQYRSWIESGKATAGGRAIRLP